MPDIFKIQKAIQKEKLSGWLFFNFHHRDKLSDDILEVPVSAMNTRPWFYLIPENGNPEKILNSMETETLKHLPGNKNIYSSQKELFQILKKLKLKKTAAQFSLNQTTISFLDYGTAMNLKKAGWKLVSSENLIQRYKGVLNQEQIELHKQAAMHLYNIIDIVWHKIKNSLSSKIYEGDVRNWILKEFAERKLVTDHDPIVASGINSSDPHYSPEGRGCLIKENEILQLDIWAKLDTENAVFADISWIAYTGREIPDNIQKQFRNLSNCRDKCLEYIQNSLNSNKSPKGLDIDEKCRDLLKEMGFAENVRHRTGHGIDTENHGSGVNLDSIEFPDKRELLNGSCFSIEPGIYFEKYGMRTEINVYIQNNKAFVSGKNIQRNILIFD